MNTQLDLYEQIASPNYVYTQYQDTWMFYLRSYMGGQDYRNGNYLQRYELESPAQYALRLANTPLSNECRSVINVYNSFLFREKPERELGSLTTDPTVESFMKDADLEGRSLDNVMKEVATWASVFGHCFILMSKPDVGANTRAEEIYQGVRPYISILTPMVVLDWIYERGPSGYYNLTYLKYIEDVNEQIQNIIEWTETDITNTVVDKEAQEIKSKEVVANGLGKIPVVIAYNQRSPLRGIGISDLTDIADQQRAICNELSEIDQATRLANHPSLVTPENVKIGTGAGSLIYIPETMDPGLKPYVIDQGQNSIENIWTSVKNRVESIDKMANTGAVRATESRTMSGVAMEVEFELLNARLSEKSDNLELAEEQLWRLYCDYQGTNWNGSINYPGSFNVRDTQNEIQQLKSASETTTDPRVLALINRELVKHLGYDEDEILEQELIHPVTTEDNRMEHIQAMIMEGYTDQQILSMHSEISQADIDEAKQDLLTRDE